MIDGVTFRQTMSHFLSGVTVVTACAADGRRGGLTANAFSSVSLEPPLILVCVSRHARSLSIIRDAARFAVQILRADQHREALAFGGTKPAERDRIPMQMSAFGTPVLDRYLALLECELVSEYPGGDHAILIGGVHRCDVRGDEADPLTYYRGRLGEPPRAAVLATSN